MILKGSERGGPTQLAAHLLNAHDNDHVELYDLRGFVADDLYGAFQEIQAISRGTKCRKFLFSLSLNPPGTEDVPVEVFEQAIEEIENKLGLTGLPRAIVFHEKQGPQGYRRHAHCVWSRIDGGQMRAINISHYKLKLTDISRSLYRQHGWEMPQGLQRQEDADPLNYTHGECQQAKRVKHDPKALKRIFVECWQRSDSAAAFASALKEHGLILAKGDRRGHVAVDAQGEVYSISRWVGVKAREVRNVLGLPDALPSVDEAMAQFKRSVRSDDSHSQTPEQSSHNADVKHAQLSAQIDLLEKEHLSVISSQKQARYDLQHHHELRRLSETKARTAKLPRGLRAAWHKLSGRYQQLVKQIETDARQRDQRDRAEYQALIERQVQKNRALQQQITNLHQQLHIIDTDQELEPRFGLGFDPAQTLVIPPDLEALTVKAKVQRDPAHILKVITDTKETFTRHDVVRKLADYIDDPLKLGLAVDTAMRSNELVEVQTSSGPDHAAKADYEVRRGAAVYSTREFQNLKAELAERVSSLSQAKGAFVDQRHINAAIEAQNRALQSDIGASLSLEQEEAIRHCFGPEKLIPIIGFAGAGKSTMLSAARLAWEKQGYKVIGAALSGKAADGLETTSGIKSRTLASLEKSWNAGYSQLTSNDVLVIDEAGMIGTRLMNRFVKAAQKSSAKLILVGDPEQLQPINAGTPFREICNTLKPARLTEIHRQKEDWQKQASLDLAQLHTAKALQAYEAHGHVIEARDPDAAIIALVEDYMTDLELHGDNKSRLALAHRRKDVHAINQAIRSAIQSGGGLAEEVRIKTDHGKRAFAKGDRILFTKNDHTLGIRNGMLGTVETIGKDRISIALDQNGRSTKQTRITINPNHYAALDHGYATTIHKSQGATTDHVYVLGSTTMDRHLTYVAMTRHKDEAKLYADKSSLRKIKKLNQVKQLISKKRQRGLKPSKSME